MNLKSAQTLVRNSSNNRLILVRRDDEFCVKVRGRRNDIGSYFTNDIQDAVDTAYAMIKSETKVQWAKGDDLDPSAFYQIGIVQDTREIVIVGGPYTSATSAWDELDVEAADHGGCIYAAYSVMSGRYCKGLRTWEDFK